MLLLKLFLLLILPGDDFLKPHLPVPQMKEISGFGRLLIVSDLHSLPVGIEFHLCSMSRCLRRGMVLVLKHIVMVQQLVCFDVHERNAEMYFVWRM